MDPTIIICVIIACVTLYNIARVIWPEQREPGYSVDDLADELAELHDEVDALKELVDLLKNLHISAAIDHLEEAVAKLGDETIKGQDGETNTPQPQDCPTCGSSDKEKAYSGCMNSWHLEYPETK